jgi:hypothetical protein
VRVPNDNDMKHTWKKLGLPIGDLPLPIVNRIKSERGTHNQIKAATNDIPRYTSPNAGRSIHLGHSRISHGQARAFKDGARSARG